VILLPSFPSAPLMLCGSSVFLTSGAGTASCLCMGWRTRVGRVLSSSPLARRSTAILSLLYPMVFSSTSNSQPVSFCDAPRIRSYRTRCNLLRLIYDPLLSVTQSFKRGAFRVLLYSTCTWSSSVAKSRPGVLSCFGWCSSFLCTVDRPLLLE